MKSVPDEKGVDVFPVAAVFEGDEWYCRNEVCVVREVYFRLKHGKPKGPFCPSCKKPLVKHDKA